ncbi:lytic transglycosylase [Labrys miyagiensis]|uniref:Lytic transglycosylase n=1 Tax=Labrys miyagiensis TaxID=346912 RepID=A0ABQ6CWY1_9HYPH|nr:lytic transglycosylase domain-containing protein [Labrys miyagiensis]GLS24184.1 lytic transglycosylase [Labrys miyagiensis]
MAAMLVRFLSGTSLFVAVLTGAVAAPLTPPGDATLSRSPATLISTDSDITGSIGAASPVAPQLQTLRQAIDAYERGDLAGGDGLAHSLDDPASRATAEWIALRNTSRQVGFQRINAFLAGYPSWPGNGLLRRRAEEALYNDGADAGTIRAFFASSPPETDEGKVVLASVLLRSGDQGGATALIRDAYRNNALSGQLESDIIRTYGNLLSRADHKFRADRLIYDGNYSDGLRVAARAGSDVVALAKVRIAVARGAGNAGTLLASNASSDPAYVFAKVSYLRRLDKDKDAAALLGRAPRDATSLVRPDAWWTERRLVARALLDQGDFRTAYAVVAGYTAESDNTRMEAEFHCGWIALRFLGDARTAARHFSTLSAQSQRPISISRGAYWQGRAAEALGDKGAATRFYQLAARYPITYYGQIARARLGIRTLDLRTVPEASAATRAAFSNLTAIRAITQLYAMDERNYARSLVSDMGKGLQDTQQLSLLGQLALANRDAKAALGVGKSATQRGLPLDAIAFPTGAIPGYQGSGNVERAVVYGIARQESEFGHDVVSGAGARGLMQMMPSTARATAKAAGMAFDPKRLATDPAYNAMIGEAHLGELIDRFRGSYIMTFAAYNAGPSKVADWVKTYGDPRDPKVDPIDWVERIPYMETRNYVQRVLENVQVYRSRLGDKSALLIDSDLRRGEGR